MATATITTAAAAASSAASGKHGEAKPPSLQTPVSASYPSELRSPLPGTPAFIKREDPVKTPITPPLAYMDFLRTQSPALMSPPNTSGSVNKFPVSERVTELSSEERSDKFGSHESLRSPSSSNPALSRQTSSDSSASFSTISSVSTEDSARPSVKSESRARPQSPRIIIPPSPFARPASARTPRRLHIPQSPFSASSVRSPMSARSMQSPYSAAPLSATPWSASFPPRNFSAREPPDADAKSKSSKVCVRQVVTRTVTYCRTPLDPAPKGKRRKVEGGQENKEESPDA